MVRRIILSPADAAALFRAALPKEQKEERVFVLPLDARGQVLAKPILVSVGSEDGTAVIDAGAIFREADIASTKELKALASRLGVPLVDHIIMGSSSPASGGEFVSLAESGRLDGICEECKSANIKSGGRR